MLQWRSRLITLDVSHSVWMRVVAGEERVMTKRTEASDAWGQPAAQFRVELQQVTFGATPLIRRYLGRSWERHLKQQEHNTAFFSDNKTTIGTLTLTRSDKNRWKLHSKNSASPHDMQSLNIALTKAEAEHVTFRQQPSATNCADVCYLCCQETWTKQETMACAHDGWTPPLSESSSSFKTINSGSHKEKCRSVCEGD